MLKPEEKWSLSVFLLVFCFSVIKSALPLCMLPAMTLRQLLWHHDSGFKGSIHGLLSTHSEMTWYGMIAAAQQIGDNELLDEHQ